MTLIITELSHYGIVMAADTAVTETFVNQNGMLEDRAFFGLTKLLPVKKLKAGISYWGWARIPPDSTNRIFLDYWLEYFLTRNESRYTTISDLANLLEVELRRGVPRLSEEKLKTSPYGTGGIHLAGFVEEDGARTPCAWHIHNGASQALPTKKLDPTIVNANYDVPPEKFLEAQNRGGAYYLVNGDIEPFARFSRRHFANYVRELDKEMDIVMPLPSIDFRANYLRTQIRFISELYAIAGFREPKGTLKQMVRGIGGRITTLTITEDGIQDYRR